MNTSYFNWPKVSLCVFSLCVSWESISSMMVKLHLVNSDSESDSDGSNATVAVATVADSDRLVVSEFDNVH